MDQLLLVQPERVLKFDYDNNQQYVSKIELSNISNVFVAFKVRLSNQIDYQVKPNIGVLRAGNTIILQLITNNPMNIGNDRVQILAGPISNSEDVIQYFKRQQRFNQRVLKCSIDGTSSIQSSCFKSTISPMEVNDFRQSITPIKTTIKKQKQPEKKEISALEEQIKQISEDLKELKERNGMTIGLKHFLISIVVSMIIGVYIAYR